ncbi:HAMP domain-containing sensor histidine kinase [Eubacterium sp. An3]|uniref:sensor histidine kinase n=1 Tax=Eubacterium sp. An3 TaxID=1965628 RepID=UPI000B38755A|nr:HAMP domain-containing sensor histidine kinase [Eubacterium sp. An3]OUO28329.1 two-component sensor histidine kinase [Eubacterium sp. An3]
MFENRTINRLDRMLDAALTGDFRESDYDETKLSRLETKWKRFLTASSLSRDALTREKENVKSLVSDISHQTKTPMTNIRLYVSLLEELLLTETGMTRQEEALGMLKELTRQTEKLEFLIQSLTKMSRLESNIVEVRPEKQPILPLLSEVIDEAVAKAEQKRITIHNTYEGEACASFDFKWTKEAVGNVLDNAVKYSPAGSTVTISVTEYEMYLAVSIKDEGIGIREEEIPKIFGRFYRAEEVRQEEGVGIGLYLTREILKKEDGYVKVKSKPGEGAEFMIYLHKGR